MVQWLRICLEMQGMWVPSLVRELRCCMLWSNQACSLQLPKPVHSGAVVLQLESPWAIRKDPADATKTQQFSSVQSLSCVHLFATPWTATHQVSLPITNSRSFLKLMSIELVMPSNHLILCRPLLFRSSIFPSIRVFSN